MAPWRWEALYNRAQPLALAFTRAGYRVVYIQPSERAHFLPRWAPRWLRRVQRDSRIRLERGPHPELTILEVRSRRGRGAVPLRADFSLAAQRALGRTLAELLDGEKAILLSSRPSLHSVFELMPWARIALDLEDPWLDFDWGRHPYAFIRITQAFSLATHIFANGSAIAEEYSARMNREVRSVPNGADLKIIDSHGGEHETPVAMTEGCGKYRISFIGKINERIDFSLLGEALPEFPEIDFFFVGPAVIPPEDNGSWRALLAAPNVFHVGRVEYDQVPAFLSHSDALLLPYSRTASNMLFPAKMLEYLVSQKPILTSVFSSELQPVKPVLNLYSSADELAEAIRRLIDREMTLTDGERALCAAFLETSTWDRRAQDLLDWLVE